VHYVFRDKDVEQRFFVERYRSQRNRLRDPSVRERPREEKARRDRAAEKYAAHESELEALWDLWLGLGRRPDESEVDDALPLTEGFGSVGKALRFLEAHKAKERGEDEVAADLAQAEVVRVEDLTVYFALEQFERRMPYKHLEPRLKRDIRQFFGDYRAAQSAGWELLRQIADVAAVEKACREAAEHGLGWLATDDALALFDLSGYGPSPGGFRETLARHRWEIDDFTLIRATSIPSLDDPCGRFMTFRQLIDCGETQTRTGLPNLPKRPESYNALHDLAVQVLDPVIDYFGMIRLDYGFCSPELARKIPGRIDPKRDQHAACEHNRRGKPVCERLGAAVDFIVDDEDMLEVARWVAANMPFDRLYSTARTSRFMRAMGQNTAARWCAWWQERVGVWCRGCWGRSGSELAGILAGFS
jgi:hypothetical protein